MKKLAIALSFLFAANAAFAQDDDAPVRRHSGGSIAPTRVTFALSPIHVTEENIGLGLSAEIFPDNGIVSFYLPFSIALSPRNDGYYDDYGYYQTPYPGSIPTFAQRNIEKETIYFYPGIKIYPTGAFKKVSYAIGLNLVAGVGRTEQVTSNYTLDSRVDQYGAVIYDRKLLSEQTANLSSFKFGAMVLNSLNIRPTDHFYMGIEFGLGYTYVRKFTSISRDRQALVQLGIKFGFAN